MRDSSRRVSCERGILSKKLPKECFLVCFMYQENANKHCFGGLGSLFVFDNL